MLGPHPAPRPTCAFTCCSSRRSRTPTAKRGAGQLGWRQHDRRRGRLRMAAQAREQVRMPFVYFVLVQNKHHHSVLRSPPYCVHIQNAHSLIPSSPAMTALPTKEDSPLPSSLPSSARTREVGRDSVMGPAWTWLAQNWAGQPVIDFRSSLWRLSHRKWWRMRAAHTNTLVLPHLGPLTSPRTACGTAGTPGTAWPAWEDKRRGHAMCVGCSL